mmetsp:Transcript_66121/g.208999  ORF Transcript_66121/g.208999 Transcript_66121/m.208999 type:complete len:305 (+) Transcript_66121:381-1295(+)
MPAAGAGYHCREPAFVPFPQPALRTDWSQRLPAGTCSAPCPNSVPFHELVMASMPGSAADFEDSVGAALLSELVNAPPQVAVAPSRPAEEPRCPAPPTRPRPGSPPGAAPARRGALSPKLTISLGSPADFEDSVGLAFLSGTPKNFEDASASFQLPVASPTGRSAPRCGTPAASAKGSLLEELGGGRKAEASAPPAPAPLLPEISPAPAPPRVEGLQTALAGGPSADFEDSVGFALLASPKGVEEKGGGRDAPGLARLGVALGGDGGRPRPVGNVVPELTGVTSAAQPWRPMLRHRAEAAAGTG